MDIYGAPDIDTTSDYEPSSASSGFTSIETAAKYHIYEHGRRYQTFVERGYPLPNDELEQSREELKHVMAKAVSGGALGLSPIGDSPQKILDLGTGCGVWAVEAGDKYPSAQVMGIDLSPIQPYFAPPNVVWKIDDLESRWPPAYENADYIHARSFLPTMTDPDRLIASAYENLRPGGWIEFEEITGALHSDEAPLDPANPLVTFLHIMTSAFAARYNWWSADCVENITSALPQALTAAGFVNVSVRREKLPLGPWPRRESKRVIGVFMQELVEGLATGVLARHDELDLTREEAQALEEGAKASIFDERLMGYMWWVNVFAQKPGG